MAGRLAQVTELVQPRMMRRLAVAGWLLSIALFLAITAYYIVCHHVSPLSRDQWHMLHALLEQGLWQTSITTVSGHRHILAFLLYDIDLRFFGANNHFLVAVDWLLNLAFIAVILVQVRRCITDPWSRRVLSGWVVVLLCWLLNIALLGWGFNGINNYLSILNMVLAVVVLHRAVHEARYRLRDTASAIALGALATLSFGNGILVWPIGLLSLYLWRAPPRFIAVFAVAAVLLLAVYLLLPGGGVVSESLRFNGWGIALFPLELMGGPFYHLLRAWRLLPEPLLLPLATGAGVLVSVLAAMLLWQRLVRRGGVDRLEALAVMLVLVGFGTAVLLTLTRVEGMLDPHVDRFQIWALLVWLGVSLLLYRAVAPAGQRLWRIGFLLFPLLALPAQLDWGARLAEYRTRVDNALLAYRVYLPVAEDAEKALHWNWQNKLPHLFPVLAYLRQHHLNIYTDGAADYLGRPLPASAGLPPCRLAVERREPVHASMLLDVTAVPSAGPYRVPVTAGDRPVGERWYLQLEERSWDAGLLAAGSEGTVSGLVQPVRHSRLPRASGLVRESYNAYGVIRSEQAASRLLLLQQNRPVCAVTLPVRP